MIYFIEYRYVLLNVCSYNALVSAGYNDVISIEFSSELSTWYRFHDLLDWCCFFYSNLKDKYIGSIYCREITVPRDVIFWMGDSGHVLMLKTGQRYQYGYLLTEKLHKLKICHLWFKGGLRDKLLILEGWRHFFHS